MRQRNSGAFHGRNDARASRVESHNHTRCGSPSPAPEPSAESGCAGGSPGGLLRYRHLPRRAAGLVGRAPSAGSGQALRGRRERPSRPSFFGPRRPAGPASSASFSGFPWRLPRAAARRALAALLLAGAGTFAVPASGSDVSLDWRFTPSGLSAVDELALTFSATSVEVDEGSTADYTVQLTRQPSASVTVNIETDNMYGATVAPAALTFTASNWDQAQTVTVTGVEDGDPGDEEVTLTHSGSGVAEVQEVYVTVRDDDVGSVPAATANVLVSNLHESLHLRLWLFRDGDFVAQAFTTGPNPAGYALESADVNIDEAPNSSGNVTVTIREDSSGNPGSTIVATLTNPSNVTTKGTRRFSAPKEIVLLANTTYWLHVQRNSGSFSTTTTRSRNERGAPGWSIADTTRDADSTSRFSTRIAINGRAVTPRRIADWQAQAGRPFRWIVRDGTFADPAGDGRTYEAAQRDGSALPAWLSFDAETGALTGTPTNADAEIPDHRVYVVLTAVGGDGTRESVLFAIRIWPDEDAPVLQAVRAADGNEKLILTYSEPLDEASVPDPGVFAVTEGGDTIAVNDIEVSGRNVALTLASAVTAAARVSYTVPADDVAMPIRDVAGNDAAALSGRGVWSYAISVRALEPRVSEGDGRAGFEISLSPAPTDPDVVFFAHWETVPGTAVPGWGSRTGVDYRGVGGSYPFGNNGNNKPTFEVWVPIVDDGLDEGDETFKLRIALGFGPEELDLVSPTSAPQYVKDLVVGIGTAEAEVTIVDDDAGPSVTLRHPGGVLGGYMSEGEGARKGFDVYLLPGRGAVSYPVTVDYVVRALTAAEVEETGYDPATAGVDFTAATGTVTFNAGETHKEVSVAIPRTPELEPDEAFAVELSSPSSGLDIEDELAFYQIVDNPGPYTSRLRVRSGGGQSQTEAGGCPVDLAVEFRDGNGDLARVGALSASDFAVENGRVGSPARDGDGWTVPAAATQGFTGLARVRLLAKEPDPEGQERAWEAAELILRVASDSDCTAVAPNALASLALDGLALDPSFDAATTAYTAAAPADMARTTVTASAVYGSAAVAIAPEDADEEADGHQVALGEGETEVTVTVTPADGDAGDALTWTVTVKRAPAEADPGVLTSFVLVDASTDADLGAIAGGATVTVSSGGSYGIRAEVEADATVGSVVMSLETPSGDTHTLTENYAPYSLYGDAKGGANGRAEHGRALAAGSYTLTATAYAERRGGGDELGTLEVAFTVEVEAPVAPPADPDGTRAGAVSLGAQSPDRGRQFFRGKSLDRAAGDAVDYYTFTTDGRYVLGLGVRDQSIEVKVVLEDANGATVGIAGPPLNPDLDQVYIEWLKTVIPSGTYYVRVEALADGATDYYIRFGLQAPPPAVSVADAQVREGADATLDFAVTLDREPTGTVTVAYATADGTATAGDDYTATSGTLAFAAGETSKTISVPVLEDDIDEGSETLTLRLSSPSGATIADGVATGTITNSDAIPEAWLARFGRTVTGQVLGAVEARLAAPRTAGAEASLAGQALPSWRGGDAVAANPGSGAGAGDDAVSERRKDEQGRAALAAMTAWVAQAGSDGGGASGFRAPGDGAGREPESRALRQRDLVVGTSFALTGGSAEGGGFASLWGRGSIAGFDGREGSLTVDGGVTTGLLGADWASAPGPEAGRWIAGMAIGRSTGTGGWRRGGECKVNCGGAIDATLTGLYPYAGLDLTERLSLWAAAGHGSGEVTVTPEGGAGLSADLTLSMGAAGLRGDVLRPDDRNGLALAVKGDARFTRTSSDAVRDDGGNLEAADADAWLVRAGLEGSRRFALGTQDDGASVTPSFELGLRRDGGDAETGLGADFGSGVAFADPRYGLVFESYARALLAHEAEGFREWGASASFGWDPRPETGRGLSLTLTRSWGASPSGGMDALLSRETLTGLAANDPGSGPDGGGFEASSRLEGELGYGLPAFAGGFTGTPNVGFGLSESARDWRVGWKLGPAGARPLDFEASLDATRRESANGDAEPEHGVMLRGSVRW